MTIKITKIKPAFVDERGEITNILEVPIKHVAIITTKAGSIRGNHYHPKQIQHDYLVSGKYEYITKDLETGKVSSRMIEPMDFVITPPNTAHAMKFLEDSVFLTLTTGTRESERFKEHTVKFNLV